LGNDSVRVDAHQHFWSLGEVEYPWLFGSPEYAAIRRDFGPADLEPLLARAGIGHCVTVQAANSFADTDAMLARASEHEWIAGVVGWVPLLEPRGAERALERYRAHPAFRGIRHLVHDEPDPDWLALAAVRESLALLSDRGLVFDIPAVFPRHLAHVPRLARELPELKIVIDHLGKPPIRSGGSRLELWRSALSAAAACPNVYAKVSGLNTVAPEGWSAEDLRPYVCAAVEAFGPDRLMFGSDWPVCLLADDYARVWDETVDALDGVSESARDAILGRTAASVYGLAL
jgi:L-fuconolactonase